MSTTGGQCLPYNGTVCKDVITWSTTWVKDPSEDYRPSSQRDVDKLEERVKGMFTLVNLTLHPNPLLSYPKSLILNIRSVKCSARTAHKT